MKLAEGDNHLIATRDSLLICQVWVRDDLSKEQGAKNAAEMSDYLIGYLQAEARRCRGLIFDVRRGPSVFGPVTRAVLLRLFAAAAATKTRVAVLVGDSAMQSLQFASICQEAGCEHSLFDGEPAAILWFAKDAPRPSV
jgi:hypothetical protein